MKSLKASLHKFLVHFFCGSLSVNVLAITANNCCFAAPALTPVFSIQPTGKSFQKNHLIEFTLLKSKTKKHEPEKYILNAKTGSGKSKDVDVPQDYALVLIAKYHRLVWQHDYKTPTPNVPNLCTPIAKISSAVPKKQITVCRSNIEFANATNDLWSKLVAYAGSADR